VERFDPSSGTRPRLTVVDDAADFRQLICDILDDRFEVTAMSGEGTTIEHVVDSRPDLLIIDLRLLPGQLTGIDLLTLVRSHELLGEVPVIVCSADMSQVREHEPRLRAMTGVHILTKPFALEDLEAVLAAALA
jgi:CheY-like chemotaxis protein